MCGGAAHAMNTMMAATGLSPRVRGSQGVGARAGGVEGSIPACAGEPVRVTFWALAVSVYPRVCGGAGVDRGQSRPEWGLSPRVRGSPG